MFSAGDSVDGISWSCVLNDVKHDIRAMKIFQQQQSSYDRAVYFGELESRRQLEIESNAVVKSFMETNCLLVPFDPETWGQEVHVVPCVHLQQAPVQDYRRKAGNPLEILDL